MQNKCHGGGVLRSLNLGTHVHIPIEGASSSAMQAHMQSDIMRVLGCELDSIVL